MYNWCWDLKGAENDSHGFSQFIADCSTTQFCVQVDTQTTQTYTPVTYTNIYLCKVLINWLLGPTVFCCKFCQIPRLTAANSWNSAAHRCRGLRRIPWNSAKTRKFRGNNQIPRLGSKFRGSRKTVGPIDYPRWHSRRRGKGVQTPLFVCLSVCALKGKRLELSTPNLVHMYSVAVAWHALTQRSKGQGHTVTKTVTVASDHGRYCVTLCDRCRRGSACRYDCLCF